MLSKFGDHTNSKSWSAKLRQKRFSIFTNLLSDSMNDDLSILDVGGDELYWENMDFIKSGINITLLNLNKKITKHDNMISIVGNACNMSEFKDKSFDFIHSNSVIEHVGSFNDQSKMAAEVQRVGKSYFLQTPNYYFPIEPHFLIIGFQFMSVKMRAFLIRNLLKKTDEYGVVVDYKESISRAKSIRLLKKKELIQLFPKATIYEEKLFGFTKSFVVYESIDTASEDSIQNILVREDN